MTINPQINTKDFLLALEREADNRENERFIEPVDYKTYDAIKSIDKDFVLTASGKSDIRDLSLDDINGFINGYINYPLQISRTLVKPIK